MGRSRGRAGPRSPGELPLVGHAGEPRGLWDVQPGAGALLRALVLFLGPSDGGWGGAAHLPCGQLQTAAVSTVCDSGE